MPAHDIFRALADPTRREILRLLSAGDHTAGELAAQFPLAPSTLSRHFTVLKSAGLVGSRRQGTTLIYHLEQPVAEQTLAELAGILRPRSPRKVREP